MCSLEYNKGDSSLSWKTVVTALLFGIAMPFQLYWLPDPAWGIWLLSGPLALLSAGVLCCVYLDYCHELNWKGFYSREDMRGSMICALNFQFIGWFPGLFLLAAIELTKLHYMGSSGAD